MADLGADAGNAPADLPQVTVELISSDARAATLKVSGQLDVATEGVLRDRVLQAIKDGADQLVLEVSGLDFMDSSGLAVLLIAAQEVAHLEVRNPSQIVQRLITLAGLAQTLPMTFDA